MPSQINLRDDVQAKSRTSLAWKTQVLVALLGAAYAFFASAMVTISTGTAEVLALL